MLKLKNKGTVVRLMLVSVVWYNTGLVISSSITNPQHELIIIIIIILYWPE